MQNEPFAKNFRDSLKKTPFVIYENLLAIILALLRLY